MQYPEPDKTERGHFPYDLRVLLEPMVFGTLVLVAGSYLPTARRAGDITPFTLALVLGGIGVVLLFFARRPLYRQRRFFAVGPRHLQGVHRKLYYAAYIFIVPCILILVAMLAVWK